MRCHYLGGPPSPTSSGVCVNNQTPPGVTHNKHPLFKRAKFRHVSLLHALDISCFPGIKQDNNYITHTIMTSDMVIDRLGGEAYKYMYES